MADNPDSYGKEQFSSDVSPNEVKVLNFLSQRKEISEAEISIEGLGQREISSAIKVNLRLMRVFLHVHEKWYEIAPHLHAEVRKRI